MYTTKIRIIIIDDHELVRNSWKMLLENDPRLSVIGDFAEGSLAIRQAQVLLPDIILVDINMSPLTGFEIAKRLLEQDPRIKVIGLSVNNQPAYATRMMAIGAKGYLTKTSPFDEILHGIIEVYHGNEYVCDEIKRNIPRM
jgi:two-component system invasion response regulator UvrY